MKALGKAVRRAGFSSVRVARRVAERVALPLDLLVEAETPREDAADAVDFGFPFGRLEAMDPENRQNFLYLRRLAQGFVAELEEMEEEGFDPPDELFVELDATLEEMDRLLQSYEEEDERIYDEPDVGGQLAHTWLVDVPNYRQWGCGWNDERTIELTWQECAARRVKAILEHAGYDRLRVASASIEELLELAEDAARSYQERRSRYHAELEARRRHGVPVPESVRIKREIDRVMLLRLTDAELEALGAPLRSELLQQTPRFMKNPSYAELAVFVWETTRSRLEVMRALLRAGATPLTAWRYSMEVARLERR